MAKKIVEIKVDKEEAPVIVKSTAVEEFEKVIAAYKIQNPAKYQLKREALEAELARLKSLK